MLKHTDLINHIHDTHYLHVMKQAGELQALIFKNILLDKMEFQCEKLYPENAEMLKRIGIDYFDGRVNMKPLFSKK